MEFRHARRPSGREKCGIHAFECAPKTLIVEDIAGDDFHVRGNGPELPRIAHECAHGLRPAGELIQHRSAYIAGRTSHQQHRVSYNTQPNIGTSALDIRSPVAPNRSNFARSTK